MPGATLATYNCQFNIPDVVTEGDVATLTTMASLLVLTEARSPAVSKALGQAGWREFRSPRDAEVRIAWDPSRWAAMPDVFGSQLIHDHGPGKYLPARHLPWQGLLHKASGTRHLVMGAHVTAGYAADAGHQAWRDWAGRQHLLAIVAKGADLMRDDRLEFHHLLGDLNAHRTKTGEWWYPVRVLDSLYAPDDKVGGLDYVFHSRSSVDNGLRVSRRWLVTEGLASDHPAHFKRVTFPRHG